MNDPEKRNDPEKAEHNFRKETGATKRKSENSKAPNFKVLLASSIPGSPAQLSRLPCPTRAQFDPPVRSTNSSARCALRPTCPDRLAGLYCFTYRANETTLPLRLSVLKLYPPMSAMSTFQAKKSSSENGTNTRSAHDGSEANAQVDTLSKSRLGLIIGGITALLCWLLFAEANASGLWREFWVSAAQVLITGVMIFVLLQPRKR